MLQGAALQHIRLNPEAARQSSGAACDANAFDRLAQTCNGTT